MMSQHDLVSELHRERLKRSLFGPVGFPAGSVPAGLER